MRKDAIVVPLAAIQRGTQGNYVYTVKNGHANLQPVKVDMTQGNISLIASGIAEGDQVVVDGQDRLQAGAAVEAHSASPNGSGNGPGESPRPDRASGAGGAAGPNGPGRAAGVAGTGGPNGDPRPGRNSGPGGNSGPQGFSKHKQAGKQN